MKTIIMMHGLPGTGKSWLADNITKHIPRSTILKTVNYRKTHFAGPEQFDEERAETRNEKDASYKALIKEARQVLDRGGIPILDATFHKRHRREWAYTLAEETGAQHIILSTECNEETVYERLKKRTFQTDEDAFLKTPESFKIMKAQTDTLSNEPALIKRVNTETAQEVIEWLKNTLL